MRIFTLLTVLGALVASVATAVAAAAAEPAFFECAKVGSGEFTSKTCSGGGPGKFSLKEGTGRKLTFSLKSSLVELNSEAVEVSCLKTKLSGENTSATTVGGVFIKMSGCAEFPMISCTSSGQKPGVILLGPLSGSLGYLNKAAKEVGVDLTGEGGHPLGEFACAGTDFQLKGSVIGLRGGDIDAVSKTFSLKFGGFDAFEGGELELPTLVDLSTAKEESATLKATFRGSGERLEVKA